ncbi:hypothetical protein RHSIM_Rhsim13G0164900 [Rhododendron simsii]|uniref:Uncharacterized protein n=1 Tax=Rhododendron simsii TaxID=118357 RepID=A0A834G137_RHOSS|nr:hypothetical protein RHSIM_Rhsim13G0164900 [Rhododendron simsii]
MPRQVKPRIIHHDIATSAPLQFDLTPQFNDAHLITLNYTFKEIYMVLEFAPEWNGGRWHTMKMETRKSKEQADANVRSMLHTEKEIIRTVSAFACLHDPDIVVLVGAPNIEERHNKLGPSGDMLFTNIHSMGTGGGSHGDVLVAYKSYMFEMEPHWHDGNGFDAVISHKAYNWFISSQQSLG